MSSPLPAATDADAPPAVRRALESVLKKKVEGLLAERCADGTACKRGSWSRSFHRVDDRTYRVGFERDTASPDSLLTERMSLTLGRRPGGSRGSTAS